MDRNGPKPFNHAHTNVILHAYGGYINNPHRINNSLIESLKEKRAETLPNQPITFSSKFLMCNGIIATAFAKQSTSLAPHSSDPSDRLIKRKLLKSLRFLLILFRRLLKTAEILAAGPDDLIIHLFNNLGSL